MTQIIYGIHPVKEVLTSPHLHLQEILIGTEKPQSSLQSILGLATAKGIPVKVTARETLDRVSQGGLHQNVIAIVKGTAYGDIHQMVSDWKKKDSKALFLILDGIQDPQNFGALIRTALGCGVQGVVIPRDRAVGITPVVMKASAGATAHLPIARVVNIVTTLESLKREGIWVFGAAGEMSDPVYHLDLNVHLAIVLGGEEKGIRPLVKKKCDRLFSIPMRGPVSSFNVSVAGGMILYEVMRQRDAMEGR